MRFHNEIETFENVAREFYPAERIGLLQPLNSGVSRVWLCQSRDEDRVVIKQFPYWFDEKDVSFVHRFNLFLSTSGVNTLHLIPNIDGQTFSLLNKRFFALYKFEDGDDYLNTANQAGLAGHLLGEFHKFSAKYTPEEARKWWTLQTHPAKRGIGNLDTKNLSLREINICKLTWEKIKKMKRTTLTNNVPDYMVIHGDFRPANLKFKEDQAIALDLDNCRRELSEMDFARSLRFICGLPTKPNWQNCTRIFLQEYTEASGIKPNPEAILICSLAQPLKEALWLADNYSRLENQTILADFQTEVHYLTTLLSAFTEVEEFLHES